MEDIYSRYRSKGATAEKTLSNKTKQETFCCRTLREDADMKRGLP